MQMEQLQKDMIAAMKARDKVRKDAISSLVSAAKKAAIDEGCRDNLTFLYFFYLNHVNFTCLFKYRTVKIVIKCQNLYICPFGRFFFFSHISYIECALLGIWYKESDS